MEDYKKKYEEALLRAKEVHRNEDDKVSTIELIFPELAESEDERIRNSIVSLIKFNLRDGSAVAPGENTTKEEALAWLEKQGEQPKELPKWKYKKDNIPLLRDSLILNKYGCVARSPADALVSDVWVIDYDELAKLPKEEYETKGEQEPTDKVEPKFKVGYWVTNSIETVQITGYDIDYGYQVDYKGNLQHRDTDIIEKEYHLWTIQDAKDGDVLVGSKDGVILMFRGIGNTEWDDVIDYHCYYDCYREDFIVQKYEEYWGYTEDNQLKPATKEQRDKLEKAITEAGYEWDAEKKELKKVEQNPNNNQFTPEQARVFDKHIDKFVKQNSTWSEEDERIIKGLIGSLTRISLNTRTDSTSPNYSFYREIDWLRALKERYTWKPSKEQVIALRWVLNNVPYNKHKKEINGLLYQIKELREE